MEDFRSRLSEASLPDSADQDDDHGTRPYRHQPKHLKSERKSPKLVAQGVTTKGKKHVEKLIKSSKDSKSPTPDIPRSIYSSAKSKSQPPLSATLPYPSTDEPRKSPAVLFSQSEEEHKKPPFLFDNHGYSKRVSESPTTGPTFIGSTSGRSSKKFVPVQQKPSDKKRLSSSSDSFSVDEPLKPLPPPPAKDANVKKSKEEEAPEVAKSSERTTPEPEQRPTSLKGHTDSPPFQGPIPHSKANKKGHAISPTRQPHKAKKHRPTRLGNHRLGKIRRRKVGIAFSPRGSTLPDNHDDDRSESTNHSTPLPKEPDPVVDQRDLKIPQPDKPEDPQVSDDTTDDADAIVQCQSAGAGSADVYKVDQKDSDSSSKSAIIPLRYLKPKATADGVREIYFHEISPAESDSSDTSDDQVGIKPKTPRKEYEKKDGDSTERKSKSLGHDNETHVEGSDKKQEKDEMVHQDGDRANLRAKRHPNTPYTSIRNLGDDAMLPELAIFVQRAKPSLGRNGRLNWKNKRQPTVLYFESKIMPNREKIQTKFIPLLPYEEKLKRLYEDNPYVSLPSCLPNNSFQAITQESSSIELNNSYAACQC